MRGSILHYDARTATGTISGDDGNRYKFSGANFESEIRFAAPGTDVDFEIADGSAESIYTIKSKVNGGQVGEKSKVAAGVLAILLGGLGIHKFYLGITTPAIIMLVIGILGWVLLFIPNLIIGIIALIEGIIYLTKSDEDFYQTYVVDKKAWF